MIQNERKLGDLPYYLLLLSALGNFAFVGYISFLWFAGDNNIAWKTIAIAGWMSRTIAIGAVVLRASISVQAGIASSMLAGIVLENPGIHLPNLAVISTMRAASPTPYTLLWHVWSALDTKNWLFSGFAAALSMTTVLLQFTSTILLTDVDTGYVTG